jgi:hypothetical protein
MAAREVSGISAAIVNTRAIPKSLTRFMTHPLGTKKVLSNGWVALWARPSRVISRFPEIRSVALVAAAVQELALAILAAELILGIASRDTLVKELAAGQGVSILRSEGAREPSGEDQQRPNQPDHLLTHSISFGPSESGPAHLSTL